MSGIPINNMGLLLQAQGKLSEAESYYREALAGRRRSFMRRSFTASSKRSTRFSMATVALAACSSRFC